MSMDSVIHKIKILMIDNSIIENKSDFITPLGMYANSSNGSDYETQLFQIHKILIRNWTTRYSSSLEKYSLDLKILIIFLYCIIVLVSIFGNSIVCKIVFLNSSMRSTTNIYIGNMSISDILMTLLNVPLQLIQILSRNWPLGIFLCKCLPFFQGLSVNVSSFTMTCIALDRHQVIAYPLKPRPEIQSIIIRVLFIWIIAAGVSIPYSAIADIEDDFSYDTVTRCRLIYPQPQYEFRKYLTIVILIIQYLIPLAITGVTYFKICSILWYRKVIGAMSTIQKKQRYAEKWKTIKMLMVVFLVFTVCWLPLHTYHIYQDFRELVGYEKHNSTIFLICHWLAMSSTCYNPFLYCWLNDKFRSVAKSYCRCIFKPVINHNDRNNRYNLLKKRIRRNNSKSPTILSTFVSFNSRKYFNGSDSCPTTSSASCKYTNTSKSCNYHPTFGRSASYPSSSSISGIYHASRSNSCRVPSLRSSSFQAKLDECNKILTMSHYKNPDKRIRCFPIMKKKSPRRTDIDTKAIKSLLYIEESSV